MHNINFNQPHASNIIMIQDQVYLFASACEECEPVVYYNYTWAIVGNAQVALWTAQVARPSY